MLRALIILAAVIVLAGCSSVDRTSSSTLAASGTSWWYEGEVSQAEEDAMDIDDLLRYRARLAGESLPDEQLAELKDRFDEDQLREGGFSETMRKETCYYAPDRDGYGGGCLILFREPIEMYDPVIIHP